MSRFGGSFRQGLLCNSRWSGTFYINQVDLELISDPPASPSLELGLEVYTTTLCLHAYILINPCILPNILLEGHSNKICTGHN